MLTKINILGGPGSGKTYIAKKLSQKLNLPWYKLDDIFWDDDSVYHGSQNPPAKRERKLKEILLKENWIIEGVYYSWLEESFEKADYIFVLKTNVYFRKWRIIKRFILRKLKLIPSQRRETMRTLLDLLKWNYRYDDHNLLEAVKMLKKHNDKVIILSKNQDIFKVFR